MKNINDYIVVFENVITPALCDVILNEFSDEEEWKKTVIGSGRVNDNVRNAETIVLSYPHVIEKNAEIRSNLDKAIFSSAGLAIQKYNKNFESCKIK